MRSGGGARQATVFPFPCPARALGRRLAGGIGYVRRCCPLAGPGVHSLAELQGGLPGLRSWSHGRERRLDPGVLHPVGRRCCLFPGRPLGDVPPGAAAGLVVHLVDVRLRSVCWALASGTLKCTSHFGFCLGAMYDSMLLQLLGDFLSLSHYDCAPTRNASDRLIHFG